MIRVLVYVVVVFLVAAGFAWLADRPGEIVLDWQGYQLKTTLMVAVLGLAAALAVLALLWWLLRSIFNLPRAFGAFLGHRRRDRGYRALSAGMIAVGAGDLRGARRAAEESRSLLGPEPLVLLLGAQAAQLAADSERARIAFEGLAARPDTRILGLHGLFVEARRQGEHEAARHFAEEAARAAPSIAWAGNALFEYRSRSGDWAGGIEALAANARAGLVGKAEAQRLKATLLAAQAMEQEAGDPVGARAAALEAHRLSPELVPAATVAARLLSRADDVRRATRVIEQTWRMMPHPDLADAYANVRPGDSVQDRLKRIRRLASLRADHPEGAMAVARAAIDARDFVAARAALASLASTTPSERVCLIMAEIEEREHGDQGRVRTWLTRALAAPRDPSWVADGRAFDRWSPVSPLSGRVGAFEWRVPAEASAPREAIEIEADFAPAVPDREPPPQILPPESPRPEPEPSAEIVIDPAPEPSPSPPGPRDAVVEPIDPPLSPAAPEKPRLVSVHAPDDPGPSAPEEAEDRRKRFRLF